VLTALGLVAVAVITLGTGYFVAAEFAFVAARRGRLEEEAATGDRRAQRALEASRRLSFVLSGAQLGITVTTLVVGFIAEPALGQVLRPGLDAAGLPDRAVAVASTALALVLATVGQMVFGELAPKNLAIARPEPVARLVAPSMMALVRVASPVIRLFDGAANRLLGVVGIEPVEELHGEVSVEELDLIVEESAQHGELTRQQATLLANALVFGGLHAGSVMTPWNQVVTLPDTATGAELRAALSSGRSRFPLVGADGDVTGVVHAKNLLAVPADDADGARIAELARPPLVVPESAGVRAVLGALRRETTEMALVVDEYGAPAGVVTLEDLAEELVGDIADEHDADLPGARREADGSWLVPGAWRLDEVARRTGIVLPEGDYDTVAGLLLDRLQRLGQVADRVEVEGRTLEVVAVDGWTITRVRLS
jgi:CBS domain containing-hemolysin-like protein